MPLPTSGDPPKGYLTVKAALKAPLRQQINVIAKVVDFMPAAQSRGTGKISDLTLDSIWLTSHRYANDLVRVRHVSAIN